MQKENLPKNAYNLSVIEAERIFNTNTVTGLSSQEAEKRLAVFGYNEFAKKKGKTLLAKFIEQFTDFLVLVLLVAAVVSGVTGHINGEGFTDALLILLIVIVNACIGVIQEAQAEKALEALEKLSAPFCKVVRDGQVETIEVRSLAPGDAVVIETGDLIPADLRLVEAVNLKVQEAALTGESLPVEKSVKEVAGDVPLGDRVNMGFSSCVVTYGRGMGIAVATGMDTEVGKIAAMIQDVPDQKTPLQIKINQLGKFLGIASIVICVAIFILGAFQGRGLLNMFMIAVSLAVAAIPEGLPAVSTIVQAIGVKRLAARNAIVRNLPSVETLGSTTVICSDKTGTLTQNKMTVVRLMVNNQLMDVPPNLSSGQEQLLLASALANDTMLGQTDGVWQTKGDPTETALVDLALTYGLNKNELEKTYPRIMEVPFDSDRRMMSTVHGAPEGGYFVYAKGGLDETLACCSQYLKDGQTLPLGPDERAELLRLNTRMAEEALRVLAVAYKPLGQLPEGATVDALEHDLIFCGMLGLIDPPRPEAREAVHRCRTAGIKPVMITGDHFVTARAIAEALGIKQEGDGILVGADLDAMTDEQLAAVVEETAVYARVSPEHKLRIVRAFKEKGEVVAMTGDGVNDAPALKLADIGVAMAITGTDVAKEAADIVLADDNFATIVAAVEEGRRIFNNILKAIQYLLATNIGEIILILVAMLANWPTPLLPVHILWINLVGDSLPALALGMDPANDDIMEQKPRDPRESILNPRFLGSVSIQGLMIGVLCLVAFVVGLRTGPTEARTMTFAVLAFAKVLHALNVRTGIKSGIPAAFNNSFLLASLAIITVMMVAILTLPALHGIFHLEPMPRQHWILVICLAVACLPLAELFKAALRMVRK